jgi:hypothetical protein
MASERVQRRIERLLDQIEEAADQQNCARERALAEEVLALDPDNQDAQTFLVAAEQTLSRAGDRSAQEADSPFPDLTPSPVSVVSTPSYHEFHPLVEANAQVPYPKRTG